MLNGLGRNLNISIGLFLNYIFNLLNPVIENA